MSSLQTTVSQMLPDFPSPPASLELEQALIGGVCLFPDRAEMLLKVSLDAGLRPEHFAHDILSRMYSALRRMSDQRIPISGIAVADTVAGNSESRSLIFAWMADCTTQGVASSDHIADMTKRLIEAWQLRELATLGEHLTSAAFARYARPVKIAERAIFRLRSIAEDQL